MARISEGPRKIGKGWESLVGLGRGLVGLRGSRQKDVNFVLSYFVFFARYLLITGIIWLLSGN